MLRECRTAIREMLGRVHLQAQAVINSAEDRWQTALWLTRLYYLVFLYISVSTLPLWNQYRARPVIAPQWPAKWIEVASGNVASLPQILTVLEILFLAAAATVALLPGLRIARILATVGLLEFVAVDNSYGQITHYWHAWLLSSLMLIFLPNGWQSAERDPKKQREALSTIWGAQTVVLLSYSMSGLWKLVFGLGQLSFGLANAFSPTALARHIAEQFIESGDMGILGHLVIAHYWLGWPLFLGAMYLELFAIYAAFRPSLLVVWGLGLITFHAMVYLTMAINFSYAALLLVVVVASSPFRPAQFSWRATLGDLPLFGWCWTRAGQARATPQASITAVG